MVHGVDVTTFSTGRLKLHPQHVCGSRLPAPLWAATSRRWTEWLPIHVFVIRHPDGVFLFDLGQDRRAVLDGASYYGTNLSGRVLRRAAQLDVPAEQTLKAHLTRHKIAPSEIRSVVLSHFHADHIGGLKELDEVAPDATVVAAPAELHSLGSRRPELNGVLPQHIDLPGITWVNPAYRELAGELSGQHGADLLGDGSMVALTTPGHTPGSQSLLVRPETSRPLLLVGDAGFRDDLMRRGQTPGVGDNTSMRRSTTALVELADRLDAVLLPAHDPDAAQRLADAKT